MFKHALRTALLLAAVSAVSLPTLSIANTTEQNLAEPVRYAGANCAALAIFVGDFAPQLLPPAISYQHARNVFVNFVQFDTLLFATPSWLNELGRLSHASSDTEIIIPKDASYQIDWSLAYTKDLSYQEVALHAMLYVNDIPARSSESQQINPPEAVVPPVGVTKSAILSLKAGDKLSLGLITSGAVPNNNQNLGYINNSTLSIKQIDAFSCN